MSTHLGVDEYRMDKMNQSLDDIHRGYGDPHADLYATVHKNRSQQAQQGTWDQLGHEATSPDSWV